MRPVETSSVTAEKTARQLPTWRGARPSSPLPSAPLATPMRMVESEPPQQTYVKRPLSALYDKSGIQGHSRSSLLVPTGIQNGVLS